MMEDLISYLEEILDIRDVQLTELGVHIDIDDVTLKDMLEISRTFPNIYVSDYNENFILLSEI